MRAYSCPSEHVVNNRGHGKQCTANAKCGTLTFNLCSVCHGDKLVGVFLILELEIQTDSRSWKVRYFAGVVGKGSRAWGRNRHVVSRLGDVIQPDIKAPRHSV